MARTTNKAEDLITFSRASTGTALTKVAYGPELVTNGTFDSDTSGWGHNNASGTSTFSVTSGEATFTRAAFGDSFYQTDVAPAVAGIYLLTFDITAISGGGLRYSFSPTSAANPSNQATASSVGSYSIPFVSDGTLLDFVFDLDANGASVTIDNISVKEVFYNDPTGTLKLISHPIDKPRVEYDANGVAKGLLIEEARTNLVTHSEDLSNAFWIARSFAKVGTAAGPFGTTAYEFLEDSSSTNPAIYYNPNTTDGTPRTFGVWLKASVPVTMALSTQGTTKSTDISVTTEWAFYWVSDSINAGIGPHIGGFHTLSVGSGLRLWVAMPQQEAGSFPTSYIPTSGATATRSADLASVSVSEFGYNQAQGSVVVEFNRVSDGTDEYVFDINDGASQRLYCYTGSSARVYAGAIGGTLGLTTGTNVWTSGSTGKLALGLSSGDSALVFDGAVEATNAGTLTTSASQFMIANNQSSGQPLNGHIKSINYYPLRLSDAKLQELTS